MHVTSNSPFVDYLIFQTSMDIENLYFILNVNFVAKSICLMFQLKNSLL